MNFEELEAVYRLARSMEQGAAQMAVFEEAIRAADTMGELVAAYQIRMDYIHAAVFSGYKEKMLVAFSWCLAKFDENPEQFDDYSLLWSFKWVLENISEFPEITREQIANLHAEMKDWFLRYGYSMRPVQYLHLTNVMRMGQPGIAYESLDSWQTLPRDEMADCEACEQDKIVEILIGVNENEKALAQAAPILNGKMSCAEIPHITLANILRPLMRMNKPEECEEYFQKGYRLTKKNRDFLTCLSEQLLYCIWSNKTEMGLKIFNRHLPWAVDTFNLNDKFCFYDSCALFLDLLIQQGSKVNPKIIIPEELPCHQETGKYDLAELKYWFSEQSQELADRFNERNQNSYYSDLRTEKRELVTKS